jgi:uncharacterized protein (DUF488 family)
MEREGRPGRLFSVGYGNRSFQDFLDILGLHGVAHVVDVRSKPYSRFNPDFSRDRLKANLEANGLGYTYLGDVLGGIPDGGSKTPDGRPDHAAIRRGRGFVNGLRRLVALSQAAPAAFMCAELRPETCHRSRLLGAALAERGVEVRHIDERGRLLSQAEAVRRRTKGQVLLEDAPTKTDGN